MGNKKAQPPPFPLVAHPAAEAHPASPLCAACACSPPGAPPFPRPAPRPACSRGPQALSLPPRSWPRQPQPRSPVRAPSPSPPCSAAWRLRRRTPATAQRVPNAQPCPPARPVAPTMFPRARTSGACRTPTHRLSHEKKTTRPPKTLLKPGPSLSQTAPLLSHAAPRARSSSGPRSVCTPERPCRVPPRHPQRARHPSSTRCCCWGPLSSEGPQKHD
jgi:hypothetical protein